MTAEQVCEATGLRDSGVRHRLLAMHRGAVVNRVRPADDDSLSSISPPWVYYLAERGARLAADMGLAPSVRFVQDKSRMTVEHDTAITQFHLALKVHLASRNSIRDFEWKQWRGDLLDKVEGHESIIPDAYFRIGESCWFVEMVRSHESEYRKGKSNLVRKLEAYLAYRDGFRKRYGHPDFRVILLLPTEERVARLLSKLEDDKALCARRFWLTHSAMWKSDLSGKIFWTPKDFRGEAYGFFGDSH